MPSSSVAKKTEEALEEVLRTIRQEYEDPYPVLCETDRNKFVEEEGSLREQLKATIESESNSWRGLLSLPSPQAAKCLKEAEELRQRVKEDINAKLRARLSGKSNPLPNSAFNLMGARTPGSRVTSPLIIHCSPSEPGVSEVNINPAVQNDHGYTSDVDEAINSPHETSSESSRSRDSSSRRHRRSPSPPRRMSQSGNSRLLSDTSSNSGSDTPRRSHSVRKPAPPPPQSPRQSRKPRSPINVSFPSPGPLPPDPARLTQQVNTLVSSIITDYLDQAKGWQKIRCSDDYGTKTNCVDINGSIVEGLTLNNGGTKNSSAVIHKTMMPSPRLPQHVPQF